MAENRCDSPILAPSILSADFANLGRDVTMVLEAGAKWIHVDVMDGVFVPNITIGPPVVKAIRKITDAPLDVHLMIANPQNFLEDFANAGADLLTVHVEEVVHLHRCLDRIRQLGMKAGVSINPGTSLSSLDAILPYTDMVLVMAVNPGFGGQSFIESALDRVQALAEKRTESDLDFLISVDGGVNAENAKKLFSRGADVLVAGSAVYANENPKAVIYAFNAIRR